jgi:hypothetical protein
MLRLYGATGFALVFALALCANPLFAQSRPVLQPDVELIDNTGAFEFNGLDQSLDLGRSGAWNLSEGDFTIHVQVSFSSLINDGPCYGPGCDMSIVDKMLYNNGDGWRLLKQSDNRFWFCLGGPGCDPASSTTVIGKTVAETGLWYGVAAVKTSSQISIYVNGFEFSAHTA